MAEYYWALVGSTGSWDGTLPLLKWASSSGGAPGAYSVDPTASDNVYFDANSGSGTVTIATTTALCANLDFTGFTGKLAGSTALTISGSLNLGTTMVTPTYSGTMTLNATSTGKTITSGGFTLACAVVIAGVGGGWTFQDNFTTSSTLQFNNGVLADNGKTIQAVSFASSGGTAKSITCGGGTWILTGSGTPLSVANTSFFSFTGTSSTFKLTDSSSSQKTLSQNGGGNPTWPTIWLSGTGTGVFLLNHNFVATVFKVDPGLSVRLTISTQLTVSSAAGWQARGSAGSLVKIDSSSAGTAVPISIASGNVVTDYLSLKDSTATGGATFFAGAHSTNVSGNTGWVFTAPTTTLSDSVTSTETRKQSATHAASETSTTSDAVSRAAVSPRSDSMATVEDVTKAVTLAAKLDSAVSTDAKTTLGGKTFSEAQVLTDSVARAVSVIRAEASALAESLVKNGAPSAFADMAALVDLKRILASHTTLDATTTVEFTQILHEVIIVHVVNVMLQDIVRKSAALVDVDKISVRLQ